MMGKKVNKDYLSCNADGSEKFTPLVIGRSKKLRSFKNVKKLPCDYTNNKTAWMISHIFLGFFHKFDRKMEKKKKRKVLLFMDSVSSHSQDLPTFNNTKVVFFPANCTSKIQPLNPSVICFVIVHYRKTSIRQLLAASETKCATKDELKQVTVLDAIHMLCSSWRSITEKCIKSCFQKAGFSFLAENECEEPENENDKNEED
ncbi:Tigger transposable element-derived protein 6 [Araneus ventricosus]|uniref:Tigger transposable element-derived protein 6 n=1 Tax=Araneus ventricosus TaxID=182803 RepID=A0A4Y2ARB3_ARAVE|nr:Tigger transposable element-derived protein 6 [Araneus ventricosus]